MRKKLIYKIFDRAREALKKEQYHLAQKILLELPPELDKKASELKNRLLDICADKQNQSVALVKPTLRAEFDFIVVTPVFNCVEHLSQTIKSIVEQTRKLSIRYHIQDGKSNDGTAELIQDWANIINNDLRYSNITFSYKSEADNGMYDALQKGYEFIIKEITNDRKSDNTICTWINGDDIFATNAFNTVHGFLKQNANIDWITGIISLINSQGQITHTLDNPKAFSKKMLQDGAYDGRLNPSFLAQEGTFWTLKLWKKVGGVNTNLRLAGDWDLWRRFANESSLVKLEAVLAYHRRHEGQLSGQMQKYYSEIDTLLKERPRQFIDCYEFSSRRTVYDVPAQKWHMLDFDTGVNGNSIIDIEKNIKKITWPKISVITPTFMQGEYIEETITSVIDQNYPNIEFIIIDGGSDDNTVSIIKKYDNFIDYWVSEKDSGQSEAINKGFEKSTGEILTWLNSDDQFEKNALFSMALAFLDGDADLVAGICEVYSEGERIHRHQTSCKNNDILPLEDLLDLDGCWNKGKFFYQPEVFFTRKLWEKAGKHVRTDCFYSMDYELWCRFAYFGAKLKVISSPIVKFRQHPLQKTAVEENFKTELISVRSDFITRFSVPLKDEKYIQSKQHKLKVVVLNDIGFKYGAGIAQERIAAALNLGDVPTFNIAISDYIKNDVFNELLLFNEVKVFNPSAIILGNIHFLLNENPDFIEKLTTISKVFIVSHDFWSITGRCAYPGECNKYLTGCDDTCPTVEEYPSAPPKIIKSLWESKNEILKKEKIAFLANSDWSKKYIEKALVARGLPLNIHRLVLGIPRSIFRKIDKAKARKVYDIPYDAFVIYTSVSSSKDKRKGTSILLEALRRLNLSNLIVITVGNFEPTAIKNVRFIQTGYLEQNSVVNALSASDLCVGASIEETLGQVFLEAAMCGVPSVGFAGSGVEDAIKHGITGHVCQETNSRELQKAIELFYYNNSFRNQVSMTAEIYAVANFSLEASFHSIFSSFKGERICGEELFPAKISFKEEQDIELLNKSFWSKAKGISDCEGPYPDFGIHEQFFWCHGPESIIIINSAVEGSTIVISLANQLFESLEIRVVLNGLDYKTLSFDKTTKNYQQIKVNISKNGRQEIKLLPSIYLNNNSDDARMLSFRLLTVEKET